MAVTISLKDKISAIATLIKNAIEHGHECEDKVNCNFDVAVFSQIAMKVFSQNTLDEISKACESMRWCKNAENVFNG